MGKFSRVGKNAKLGDGSIIHTHKNASAMFTSTDIEVLKVKQMMCFMEGITHADFRTQASGYGGEENDI
jgi:hypothetical protein